MYDVDSDTNHQAKYFQNYIINNTSYVYIILPMALVRFIAFNFRGLVLSFKFLSPVHNSAKYF